MIYLLLQATPVLHALPTIAEEIALHPYLFLGLLTALATITVGLSKMFLSSFEARVNEKYAECVNRGSKQEGRLEQIEEDLRGYDKHVALGAKESTEIFNAIGRVETALTDHTRKEETITWTKIDDLVIVVTDMKLSNEVSHERFVAGQAVLASRVERLENSLPNGEITALRLAIVKSLKPVKRSAKKRK